MRMSLFLLLSYMCLLKNNDDYSLHLSLKKAYVPLANAEIVGQILI